MKKQILTTLLLTGCLASGMALAEDGHRPSRGGPPPHQHERPDGSGRHDGPPSFHHEGFHRPNPAEMFRHADANKDGAVDKGEMMEAAKEKLEQVFKMLDADKNGKIDRQEAARAHAFAAGKASEMARRMQEWRSRGPQGGPKSGPPGRPPGPMAKPGQSPWMGHRGPGPMMQPGTSPWAGRGGPGFMAAPSRKPEGNPPAKDGKACEDGKCDHKEHGKSEAKGKDADSHKGHDHGKPETDHHKGHDHGKDSEKSKDDSDDDRKDERRDRRD